MEARKGRDPGRAGSIIAEFGRGSASGDVTAGDTNPTQVTALHPEACGRYARISTVYVWLVRNLQAGCTAGPVTQTTNADLL